MKFWRYNKQYCTMVKLINFRLFILFFCPNNYCAVDIIILKIINYWSWNLCIALNTEYNILIWFFLFQELADVDNVKTTIQHHHMLLMVYYPVDFVSEMDFCVPKKLHDDSNSFYSVSYICMYKIIYLMFILIWYSQACLKGHLYITNYLSIKGSLIFPINEYCIYFSCILRAAAHKGHIFKYHMVPFIYRFDCRLLMYYVI